jgi:hypothetical protein
MWFCAPWALLGPMLCAGVTLAQGKVEKEPGKPPEVEVRFADGSNVRMVLVQEHLDVATRYGKLTIPLQEIRRIDFGLHLPEGVGKKVEDAVKRLGSESFKDREAASQELVDLGAYAYPAVQNALKSTDLEVAQRAAEVIKRLREKVPADELRLPASDRVQTVEFPVTGRLVSPTIRARSAYFGDVQLKLAELRSIRWTTIPAEVEVTVDAAKHGSPNSPWLDTGVEVSADGGLVVAASGQVDLWPATPGQYMTGPTGYKGGGQAGAYAGGTLLGRVGENGKVFVIGERYEGTPNLAGKLYLLIAPSPWNNVSAGSYTAKIAGRLGR